MGRDGWSWKATARAEKCKGPEASLPTLRPPPRPPPSVLPLTGLPAPRPTPASAPRAAAWRAGIARRCSFRIPGASRAARACRGWAGERAPRVATHSPPRAPTGRAERVLGRAGRGSRKAPALDPLQAPPLPRTDRSSLKCSCWLCTVTLPTLPL